MATRDNYRWTTDGPGQSQDRAAHIEDVHRAFAEGMVVLGYDDPVPIAADADGRVWAIEDGPRRFVNRSVSAFGRCLVAYEWYRRSVLGLDENAALAIVHETAARLRAADPEALANEEHYWAIMVEQMEYGHL
jgi:hypothetical protein